MTFRRRQYEIGSWLLTILTILPIWLLSILPLVDLPLHTARTYILHSYNTSPFFQQIFEVVLEPIPNIGTDLIMIGLQSIMSVDISMNVLLTLTVLVFVCGVNYTFRTFAPDRYWLLLLTPLLSYHTFFVYGFLNYTFGLGLFFFTFSYWYRNRFSAPERNAVLHWLTLAFLALACYLTHLSSFAFLGVAVGTVTLLDLSKRALNWKSIATSSALLTPLLLFAIFMKGSGTNAGVQYSDLRGKITSMIIMFTSYDVTFDLIMIVLFVLTVAVVVIRAQERKLNRTALILATVFFACFLLSPAMLFTSHMADARLMPVATVFALSSFTLTLPPRFARVCITVVILLFVARASLIVKEWTKLSPQLAYHYDLVRMFPEGSRIKALYYPEVITLDKHERPFEHLLSYLMIEKDVLVSDFIAKRGQQPVVYRTPLKNIGIEPTKQLDGSYLASIEEEYDHLWAYKLSPKHLDALNKRYTLLHNSEGAALYRIR